MSRPSLTKNACDYRATAAGGIALSFGVSPQDASGERTVTITQGVHTPEGFSSTASPPGNNSHNKILLYMNNTDLGGGDYNTTHLPAGTDPHQCAALCMQDPKCMVWVYVIRKKPAGSGDCIFKNENHECPAASPHSTTQGMCTAGRGHEPIGHKCKSVPKPGPPHPAHHKDVMPPVRILKGESLDVRGTHKNSRNGRFVLGLSFEIDLCRPKRRSSLSRSSFLADRLYCV